MWPAYAEAIEVAVGAKLDDAQAAMLTDILGQIGPSREQPKPSIEGE